MRGTLKDVVQEIRREWQCGCEHGLWRAEDTLDLGGELRQFIQEENAAVHQRHLPWQGPRAAADHTHSGDGVTKNHLAHVLNLTALVAMATRVESAKVL
jgi:hypothetical protein